MSLLNASKRLLQWARSTTTMWVCAYAVTLTQPSEPMIKPKTPSRRLKSSTLDLRLTTTIFSATSIAAIVSSTARSVRCSNGCWVSSRTLWVRVESSLHHGWMSSNCTWSSCMIRSTNCCGDSGTIITRTLPIYIC